MSTLHIVGFGGEPKHQIKARIKWVHAFPDSPIEIEPDDVIVVNLNEVHDEKQHQVLYDLVNFIGQKGGVLVGIAGPNKQISRDLNLYDFLPFSTVELMAIFTTTSTGLNKSNSAPRWIDSFINCMGSDVIAPVYFAIIPNGALSLILSYSSTVGISYKYRNGRILILPSIKSIIHGETTSSAKSSLTGFLQCLYNNILSQYLEPSSPPPEWLDSIVVQNEEELKDQYDTIGKEIKRISEEKNILADTGKPLTRKVSSLLKSLGFQIVEKENKGKQDIDISEDDFKGVVECSGSVKHIQIDKLRQLMDYAFDEGIKGIIIGNPWRLKHPNSRELSKAFTEPVVRRAEVMNIGLVTVPHLYRVFLDSDTAAKKKKVRDSLKRCVGLWKYPAKDW